MYIKEHIHRPFVFAFIIIIITITKVLVVAIVQAVIKI